MIYDIIVLGGGPAGYLFAQRAGAAGKKILLIEKRAVGGVCLHEGCIPTKALLHSAKIYYGAKNSQKFGIKANDIEYDQNVVIARKNKIVDTLEKGILLKLKENNAELILGSGEITSRDERGFIISVNGEEYICAKLVIATGSSPSVPDIPGLRHGLNNDFVLTSKEALDITEIPGSLIVAGGGTIGLEMADYYNSVGSEVTVTTRQERIASSFDRQISEILQKNLKKKGIKFITGATAVEYPDHGLKYERNGAEYVICADRVLLSAGRKANIHGLGLDILGVKTEKGAIVTNNKMRTNIENVYAIGDVNGKSMLAHTAYREAIVALNDILGIPDEIDYMSIPSVIYTSPEVASVGYSEREAADNGIDHISRALPLKGAGRYACETAAGDGICKMMIEKSSRKVIGFSIIGPYSSEIIVSAALIIARKLTADQIKTITFPHPSVCEIIFDISFCF